MHNLYLLPLCVNGAKNIILVAGTSNVDGIIVAPLAKSLNAPILLVEKNKISNNVKIEIKRLKPTKAYLIGGTAVISNKVIDELKTLNIASERVYGDTRYTTAVAVAKKVGNFNKVIICNSKDGGKNVAAIVGLAAQKNIPVLYNDSNSAINTKTYTYIKDNIGKIKTIYLIGNGVSTAQQKELKNKGVAIVKITSKTPYDINVEMINKLNMKTNSIALVNNAIDAISISYLTAKTNSILLYTNTRLTIGQKKIINDNSIKTIYYTGGGKIKGAVKDAIYTIENKKVNTDTKLEFNQSKVVFYIPHQEFELKELKNSNKFYLKNSLKFKF